MKTSIHLLLTLLATGSFALAHDDHKGHDHGKEKPKTEAHAHAGEKAPNGGRIIHSITPHAEFLVTKERNIEIRFLDGEKVIAPAGQSVTVTTGSRSNPTRIAFTAEADKLVSSQALPEGSDLPVVLQIKVSADAKTVTERFTLNLAECPTCDHLEYACTCAHGDHSGHSHGDGHKH